MSEMLWQWCDKYRYIDVNSCIVLFSRNSCFVFWQFFAKDGITVNEFSEKHKYNHGGPEVS